MGRITKNQFIAAICILIFVLAFLLRAYPLQQYRGWDEASYLQIASQIAEGKDNYSESFYRPPLVPLVLALGMRLTRNPFFPGLLIAFLSATIVPALFLAGRRLHSDGAGLAAGLLAAIHPLYVLYGHLVLTDSLVAAIAGWALFFALGKRKLDGFAAGGLVGLAGITKFTGLALIPLFVAWFWFRDGWKLRLPAITGFGISLVVLPYLLWAQISLGSWFAPFKNAQELLPTAGGGPGYYLSIALFTIPLLFGLIAYAALFFRQEKANRHHLILAVSWFFLIGAYLLWQPYKEMRYALLAIVPLFLLAGIGYSLLAGMAPKATRLVAIFAIAAFVLAGSAEAFGRLHEPAVNSWVPPSVEIAIYIQEQQDLLPIYVTSYYPVFGYYTSHKVIVVDGPAFLDAYPLNMGAEGYLVVTRGSQRQPTEEWAATQEEMDLLLANERFALYKYTPSR